LPLSALPKTSFCGLETFQPAASCDEDVDIPLVVSTAVGRLRSDLNRRAHGGRAGRALSSPESPRKPAAARFVGFEAWALLQQSGGDVPHPHLRFLGFVHEHGPTAADA
jgi:hypothetical protein